MAVIAIAWLIWFRLLLEKSLLSYSANNFSTSATTTKNNKEINTVLIMATVPYSADHAMALWTQLECLTSGIDRVLISAPDASWSKEIISLVINRFTQLSNNVTTFSLEAVFNLNNRYDVGLWCDGIDHIHDHDPITTSAAASRAIFLINDSAAALRQYDALTNRIVAATQNEQLSNTTNNMNDGGSVKVISLNGDLTHGKMDKTWIESVYRGLTPDGLSTFYNHSCSAKQRQKCACKRDNAAKNCIVTHFEKALAREYLPLELDVMFPSFVPREWNTSSWEASNGPIQHSYWEHWLHGNQYYWYLYEVHGFPLRKLKWPEGRPPPSSQCLKLLDSKTHFFDELPYPSNDVLRKYQEEIFALDCLVLKKT